MAKMPLEVLRTAIGEASALHLHDLAWNRDERPVVPERGAKSIGHEQTYSRDLVRRDEVHFQLVRLSDATVARLRSSQKAGRTVTVKVRFGNFETVTRSRTLPKPTAGATALLQIADELTAGIDPARGIRLLGISLSNLEDALPAEQLAIDAPNAADDGRLDDVVDKIRERYGHEAVVPAPLVDTEAGGILRKGPNSR
jgi:DNA polymerase-4